MKNKLTFTGANILFFSFTIVFMLYQFLAGIFLGTAIYDNVYAVIIINELLIASFVLVYCIVKKIDIKETFRFKKLDLLPAILIVLISLPAMFAASMLNDILIYFLQFIIKVPASSIPVPQNASELAVSILLIGVMPGVCEELMHRGFLLTAYEKRGSYKAVVIVAILFGLFHFDITNLLGPIFLGLLIGYYVVRTGSIFAGILAHFMNNTLAQIIQFMFADEEPAEYISLSLQELIGIIGLGIVSLIAVAGLLYLFTKVTEGKAEIRPPISGIREDVRAVLTYWPIIAVVVLYVLWTLFYILIAMVARFVP